MNSERNKNGVQAEKLFMQQILLRTLSTTVKETVRTFTFPLVVLTVLRSLFSFVIIAELMFLLFQYLHLKISLFKKYINNLELNV
ncbi:MAG: hypothetical protein IKJ41_10960 [Clostridia bacterium]|nr:hypothetical protein [Clostridia bacterium]